ncbi:MAG: EAL domain-containing protein, partial [Cyanobacteria bacterium J06628_4]
MSPIHQADTNQMVVRYHTHRPSKILIVDDLPSNVRLLSTALNQAGYHVCNASSGTRAMVRVAVERPDLILLDIKMPDLDGFAVCRQLHGNNTTADIPIIFMSALDQVPDKLRAFSVGAADYITKPFQIAEVLARIEHQLELRRLRQTLKTQNQKLRIVLQQYEIAEAQVHHINQELEQRVQTHTNELRNTNRALKQELSKRQQAQANLMHLAMHDPLTGLPNRTQLIEHIEERILTAQPGQERFALLILECDRCKAISDTLGHLQGDRLLLDITHRILATAPDGSVVARLTDDKFAILPPSRTHDNAITLLIQHLQQGIAAPIVLGDHEITTSAHVGVVLADSSYCCADSVLRDGSLALIQAKQKPEGWRVFQPDMHRRALHRLTLESLLRQALRQEQLQIFYQPIVALTSVPAAAPIVGYEALVRWQPEGSSDSVSPADFIPLAEESDLISQLGNWVFRRVCEQLSQWHQTFSHGRVPFVSVNFSARHLQDEQFIQQIDTILKQTRVQPSWLKFEITENLLIGDTQPVFKTLAKLRQWGIQISIDDFGTGYSSLSYLKQLPVDTLKIDRAFIKDMKSDRNNLKIVEAIVQLSQVLDLDVVAEGIETEWQAQQLIELGCRYGQGYLFSYPLDSSAASSLLARLGED